MTYDKDSTQNSGEKMAFSKSDAGTNGYLYGKKLKFDLYFTPYTKINFRRTVQQNVKGKRIKLLEDNIERLSPIGKQARN